MNQYFVAQSVSFTKNHNHVQILQIEDEYSGVGHGIRKKDQDVESHRIHHGLGKSNSMANLEWVKKVVGIYSLEEMDGGCMEDCQTMVD